MDPLVNFMLMRRCLLLSNRESLYKKKLSICLFVHHSNCGPLFVEVQPKHRPLIGLFHWSVIFQWFMSNTGTSTKALRTNYISGSIDVQRPLFIGSIVFFLIFDLKQYLCLISDKLSLMIHQFETNQLASDVHRMCNNCRFWNSKFDLTLWCLILARFQLDTYSESESNRSECAWWMAGELIFAEYCSTNSVSESCSQSGMRSDSVEWWC